MSRILKSRFQQRCRNSIRYKEVLSDITEYRPDTNKGKVRLALYRSGLSFHHNKVTREIKETVKANNLPINVIDIPSNTAPLSDNSVDVIGIIVSKRRNVDIDARILSRFNEIAFERTLHDHVEFMCSAITNSNLLMTPCLLFPAERTSRIESILVSIEIIIYSRQLLKSYDKKTMKRKSLRAGYVSMYTSFCTRDLSNRLIDCIHFRTLSEDSNQVRIYRNGTSKRNVQEVSPIQACTIQHGK